MLISALAKAVATALYTAYASDSPSRDTIQRVTCTPSPFHHIAGEAPIVPGIEIPSSRTCLSGVGGCRLGITGFRDRDVGRTGKWGSDDGGNMDCRRICLGETCHLET